MPSSKTRGTRASLERLRGPLDALYAGFNRPDAALDPIQIVRRYERLDDREIVAFVAAALAFGRVGSVMASAEALCRVMGPRPAEYVRSFRPQDHAAPLLGLVHRWTRGADFVALLWVLSHIVSRHGSLEEAFVRGLDPATSDLGPAIEHFSTLARAVDLTPVYGRRLPERPGVHYFFSRPSSGGACKRLNLFLRWMTRRDAVDPGGWARVTPAQLIVPLDTHTIRVGRCLRLTTRQSPGWKMAVEITAALRTLDPVDPVRYDFSLCHLSMMGGCGWRTSRGNRDCPLRDVCRPARR